jgi:DNA helicase-2/ATP-dependent DNA helicase PcrA
LALPTPALETTAAFSPRRIDYRNLLNPDQLAVVEAPPRPCLIIAGAGSGKTRTLTFRVARLLEDGCPPEGLLLLTFTNKAAREMQKRVGELCGGIADVRRIQGGTFHRVALRLLREHASVLGFAAGFGLLDREDARVLMGACIDDCQLGMGPRRFPGPDVMVDLVSSAANTQTPLHEILGRTRPQLVPWAAEVLRVATRFRDRKARMQLMDFDDLLVNLKVLLDGEPEIRRRLQDQVRAVLVDEFQDTNRLQGDLVDLFAGGYRNVTVVGDDAQSIYSFRGADLRNLLEFPARYPGCGIFRLTRNYRSTPEILALANASIARNPRQFPKELSAARSSGPLPTLVALRDVYEQARFIAQRVLALRDEGVPLSEQAVLYRAHEHAMEIQLELSRRGIPFTVRSGVRFLEKAHVKDALAFLRFIHNPLDELSFKRVLGLYPGIGSRLAEHVWGSLQRVGAATSPLAALLLPNCAAVLPKRARPGFARAREALLTLTDHKLQCAPGEMLMRLLDSSFQDSGHCPLPNEDARADDLRHLAELASRFASLGDFLVELALVSERDARDAAGDAEPVEHVTLSSVHQAKGLEWRAVFVVWLADGRFPLSMAIAGLGEEEERRLFHVAATRARDELTLTYPEKAAPNDRAGSLLRISRFIEELPSGHEAPYRRVPASVERLASAAGESLERAPPKREKP